MTIYSFYIFDRHCNCIYSREWFPHKKTSPNQKPEQHGTVNQNNEEDSAKLLFGAIFSLRNIATKLGGSISSSNYLKSFATSKYRTHYYETASGLRFCLLSDPSIDDMQNVLKEIYTNYYLEHVVKNALSPIDFEAGETIGNENFITSVDRFIMSLSVYS